MKNNRGWLDRINLPRRRFVQGLTAGGALAALGAWTSPAWAATNAGFPNELRGTDFDLTIGTTPMNYTGKTREATTINGSIPGPLLRLREGSTVSIRVKNTLQEDSSIHWHGLLLPFIMDGVPGIAFPGIAPGETFTYKFQVQQSGTYWYHSHSRFQEQTGMYGPIIIDPAGPDPIQSDRDYVLMLSDWTDSEPEWIFRRLKQSADFFNYQMPTVGDFVEDTRKMGFSQTLEKRMAWDKMRMNPTDLGDVSGSTFTYLANGTTPAGNWTAIARKGEKVRLRVINGSATTIFDVRIPGLKMTVVSADGQQVEPVAIEEFRISVAETYDVIVEMPNDQAYTIFAQSIDRTGYARATLAPKQGMVAAVPELDPKTWLSMVDMGMGDMEGMQGMEGHDMSSMPMKGNQQQPMPAMGAKPNDHSAMRGMPNMPGHDMSSMKGTQGQQSAMKDMDMSSMKNMKGMDTEPGVDARAMSPSKSLSDPGPRLRDNGRRVLTYSDLRTVGGPIDPRGPGREITLRLTGNMQRFVWGFDGKKFSEAEPVYFKFGERLRMTMINDSMMNHPIHLHGMWMEIESEEGKFQVRKHTVNVQPGKQISLLIAADAPGQWAFHCHLLYHMEAGMFRMVVVA